VVFSFFRKNKSTEDEPKQAKPVKSRQPVGTDTRPVTKPAPVTGSQKTSESTSPKADSDTTIFSAGFAEGIEVVETHAESCSAIEEAAIYYANARIDQAIASLVHGVKENADIKESQPWLMLFDLYQMSGSKQKFEELAMEFVVKFERSPPAWIEKKLPSEAKQPEKSGSGNYFAFTGDLSAAADKQFQQLHATAKNGAVRLDLSKIQSIDADGSRLLSVTLQTLCKEGVKIQYSGVATLVGLLNKAIEAGSDSDTAHWLLLLDLNMLQGKQVEFEDLAVEYAVTFEVSPPSWEQLACRVKAEEVKEPAAPAGIQAAAATIDGFAMEGVISAASETKLKELVAYAAGKSEVHIDMSRVTRVDFVSVGSFLNALIEVNQGGRKVFIEGANEMVNALFGVMGVGQFATILRKTKF
jgi:anti-anti-sigma regulatory factor